MAIPTHIDWSWVTEQSPADLARHGTDGGERATWVHRVYRWFFPRAPRSLQQSLPAPLAVEPMAPDGLFPLLCADPDCAAAAGAGALRFLQVRATCEAEDAREGAERSMQSVVNRTLRYLVPPMAEQRNLRVRLLSRTAVDGDSGGLAAVIAGIAATLALPIPDDAAATGAVRDDCLYPVAPETLRAKLEAARTWGYKRVLIVDGQLPSEGLPDGVEVLRVSNQLPLAVLDILRLLWPHAGDEQVALLLALFDERSVRSNPHGPVEKLLAATFPFISEAHGPLTRRVSRDIRSRILLHAGRTNEADQERRLGTVLVSDVPEGWLGGYLQWNQVAHHAMIAIDLGRWADDDPAHVELDEALRSLDACMRRGATPTQRAAVLALQNTRARRRAFRARLNRDAPLLHSAWEDVSRGCERWRHLFDRLRRLGLRDYTLRRQHNQCVELLYDVWCLTGSLPTEWGYTALDLWPGSAPALERDWIVYDKVAWVRWQLIHEQPLADGLAAGLVETLEHGEVASYPDTLLLELVLRHRLGDDALRHRAARALSRSALLSGCEDGQPPEGILRVLAIRAWLLCSRYVPDLEKPFAPAEGTALFDLARLLWDDQQGAVNRCPY